MTKRVLWAGFLCVAIFGSPDVVRAGITSDPAGDFLSTYLGPQNGDLDVVGAEVTFNGTDYIMHAVLNGNVGTTAGAIYVLGFNRGAGTAGFASLGLGGILFDRVIVINNNDTSATAGVTVSHSGHGLFADIPLSLPAMASTGFAPQNYTWNLWPRNPLFATGNPSITDFAPDNSNVQVTSVPEPSTFAMILFGFPLAAIAYMRRRAVA